MFGFPVGRHDRARVAFTEHLTVAGQRETAHFARIYRRC
jgi:hypothetical protein